MTLLEPLVLALSRLPGIGEKSATRLALFILRDKKGLAADLIKSLQFITEKVLFCRRCQNLSEKEICPICNNSHRSQNLLCIVQEPMDLLMIEKMGDYRGLYYVLHGVISPLDGVGPDDLKLKNLIQRVKEGVTEVILATNPNAEGETTALYLKKILASLKVKITRIASGIPVGGSLEYTDAKTLAQAMGHRRDF